ncbi:DUF3324 domain-containing protein [Weissella confusa]|uniref:DUF3324 domain-containing protein n=1 Tax=Weissella confusa TaxID=1583 RepID=A0A923NGM8_WEICO|nr:DUF3324 domain-containing protein [Weissella confusa]
MMMADGQKLAPGKYVADIDLTAKQGHWHFKKEFTVTAEKARTLDEQNVTISHWALLHESPDMVAPNLNMHQVRATSVNYHTAIQARLQNDKPAFITDMKSHAVIYTAKDHKRVLAENKKNQMISVPDTVWIPAHGTTQFTAKLRVQKEQFSGIAVGGISFVTDADKGRTQSTGVQINNRYAYDMGLVTKTGYYDLNVEPGQEQNLEMTLMNDGDKPMRVHVSANPASTNDNGVIEYGKNNIAVDKSLTANVGI